MKKILFIFSLCTLYSACIPKTTFAQDSCDNLTANPEWNQGILDVSQLIQANRFTEAQTKAKQLTRICSQTAVLNYMQGKIAAELGQKSEALLFYQKASEATYKYAVDPDMAKKIWYARYENEHPERTAKSIKEAEAKSDLQLNQLNTKNQDLLEQLKEERIASSYRLMWTGVGIGTAGLVLAGTGLGLILNRDAAIISFTDVNNGIKQYNQRPNPVFVASTALLASGAAFAITGAILTGIFGYQYSKYKDEAAYSIAVMPNNLSVSIQF